MKKTYMNPKMVVVKIETQKMLAASDPDLNGGNYQNGDPVLAPEMPSSVFDI